MEHLVWPADFSRVPYRVFQDPAIFDLEQQRLYRGPVWNYLALDVEVPNPGDFKSTYIGNTRVVLTRGKDGSLNAWVNRCAHRGALVEREERGNRKVFRCFYHQWCYEAGGDLVGIPYQKGINGSGGLPDDFASEDHGLETLRVESYRGLVFGTFSRDTPALPAYLGESVCGFLDRTFKKPLRVLGHMRQTIPSNWKLYFENVKDPYHAGLLHLFHATFGLYRSTQEGGVKFNDDRSSSIIFNIGGEYDIEEARKQYKGREKFDETYDLRDPSLLESRPDHDDGIANMIMSLFPSVVVQQIKNTMATRHIRPRGPDSFELYWTYVGYQDDDEELTKIRLKQANLVGPAGYISMEDGEATRSVQEAIRNANDSTSVVEMGGRGDVEDVDNLISEAAVRGFWRAYARLLGFKTREGRIQ
jgi:anthranilate 1,2-dioxygenase large subunit